MVSIQSIEIIGIIAISIMVISYALEDRNPLYIALFAFGCVMAAIYAFLISSYPFLVAESVWSVVAFARWRRSRQPSRLTPSDPFFTT